MALYENGILISGANTLPQMTLAEYQALPVSERPTYWERTDLNYNNIPASDVTYGSGSVKDVLDDTATQLASRANIKRGVNWITTETIPLSTTVGAYSLKCGFVNGYTDLFIVYDGGWKTFGTNNIGVTISGDNLVIPRYAKYLLIW